MFGPKDKQVGSRTYKKVKKMPTTKFTEEQDKKLIEIMSSGRKMSWASIAEEIGTTASPSYVSNRWRNVLNPNILKGMWTEQEDNIIRKWVKKNGVGRWKELSTKFQNRTGKQLKNRWETLERKDKIWTEEEDKKLVDLHGKYGNQWSKIAFFLPYRTSGEVKNRWNSTLKRINIRRELGLPDKEKPGRKPKSLNPDTVSIPPLPNILNREIQPPIDGPFGEEKLHRENENLNTDDIWGPLFSPF